MKETITKNLIAFNVGLLLSQVVVLGIEQHRIARLEESLDTSSQLLTNTSRQMNVRIDDLNQRIHELNQAADGKQSQGTEASSCPAGVVHKVGPAPETRLDGSNVTSTTANLANSTKHHHENRSSGSNESGVRSLN